MNISHILRYLDDIHLDYVFYGDPDKSIENFCPLKELKDNSMIWVRELTPDIADEINGFNNLLVFLPKKQTDEALISNRIIVDNPHRTFFIVLKQFFYTKPIINSPKVSVIETDNIGENTSFGEFCYVGPDVTIGRNCVIGNNVTIENKVVIGDDVIIDSGARIGIAGFGHYKDDQGQNNWIPHLGGVSIGNHVFIGANTIVARGTLSDTTIHDYVMIDMLCGVAHNSEIFEGVIMAGGAGVAGSAVVMEDTWLAPGCIINAGVKVGRDCLIGINSVVSHDVPDGKYAFGIPAKVITDNNDKKYRI